MPPKPADIVGKVLRDYDEDSVPHKQVVTTADKLYRAYRGFMDERSGAAQWKSKLHPSYAFEVIEVLTANVVDARPGAKVTPQARMSQPDALHALAEGAKANELLLNVQYEQEKFALKQMHFAKQGLITGLTVAKTHWAYSERDQHKWVSQPLYVDDIGTVAHTLGQSASRQVVMDDPVTEIVDIRDWVPHQAASSLENCLRVTHRVWMSYDEIKRHEQAGVFGSEAGGESVDGLKESKDFRAEVSARDQTLFKTDRTKDKIEVLEMWRREPDGSLRVVSIGNRKVLLRDQPSPFWHGQFPFVVCAPIPDLGRIHGIAVMELIHDQQEALWSLLNQRLDNLELLNNAVIFARDDLENIEDLEIAPGAVNIVSDPSQVVVWQPNPQSAEISLPAEERLKQDIQSIPGASPTLLGQTDSSQQTATEISVTTTLAQKRIALMKQQFKWAYAAISDQRLQLNQQFVTEPRLVQKVGADGAQAFQEIHPLLLQGEYGIQVDAMDESLLRNERVAEAQATLQVMASIMPVWAAVAQNPAANLPMLNMKAGFDALLEAKGVSNKESYYSAAPPPQMQMPPPAQPGQPGPGGAPQGVTAPQATDVNSPSNAFSQSPVAALQRQGAMAGGPANTPNG